MDKNIKYTILISMLFFIKSASAQQSNHQFDPPWNTPPQSAVMFTVAGIDNVPDLFGDINNPQLVVFFAGNQFMVIDTLLSTFKKKYPQYSRVFAETLPPGILAQQIKGGSITIGNLKINLQPDVYTAGKSRIDQTPDWFDATSVYAKNKLAIMVQKSNPKHIRSLADLGRPDVRVSMPNPAWEGIGKRLVDAFATAGGASLQTAIVKTKVADSTTFLTQIHHRQSPMRILYNESDAAPVWYSEAYYQKMIHHPVELVELPEKENIKALYVAGLLKTAPHKQAARDFMNFLVSDAAKNIYRYFGFTTD